MAKAAKKSSTPGNEPPLNDAEFARRIEFRRRTREAVLTRAAQMRAVHGFHGDEPAVDQIMPAGAELGDFIDHLVEIAHDRAINALNDRERTQVIRHANMLKSAVEYLLDSVVPEKRELAQQALWQAIGSACLIVSYQAVNPFEERMTRERRKRGSETTKGQKQQRLDILKSLAGPFLRSMETPPIVDHVLGSYNEQLEKVGLPPQERNTVIRLVDELRPKLCDK
jgi:hypothetical protein